MDEAESSLYELFEGGVDFDETFDDLGSGVRNVFHINKVLYKSIALVLLKI